MFETVRHYGAVGTKLAYRRLHRTKERVGVSDRELPRVAPLSPRDGDLRLCFLCYGNICRSPFAARYLRQQLDSGAVSVTSAGFYSEEGRPSPKAAVTAAADFGVDLDSHRSRRGDWRDLITSDALFLMDYGNLFDLKWSVTGPVEWYASDLSARVFFLGAFDGTDDVVIEDPHGSTPDQFRRTYRRIADCVDALAEQVAGVDDWSVSEASS